MCLNDLLRLMAEPEMTNVKTEQVTAIPLADAPAFYA
jgi:hypothetical protein